MGVPGVCWKLKKDANVKFDLYELADHLRYRGWLVPAYSLPPNCEDVVIQRILVRHGVSKDLLEQLLVDMDAAIRHLNEKPNCSKEHKKTAFHH
jgi:glutamate decarboxylase